MSNKIQLWTTANQQALSAEQFENLKTEVKSWVANRWPRVDFEIVEKTHPTAAHNGWSGDDAWRAAFVVIDCEGEDNVSVQNMRESLLEFVNNTAEDIQDAA